MKNGITGSDVETAAYAEYRAGDLNPLGRRDVPEEKSERQEVVLPPPDGFDRSALRELSLPDGQKL